MDDIYRHKCLFNTTKTILVEMCSHSKCAKPCLHHDWNWMFNHCSYETIQPWLPTSSSIKNRVSQKNQKSEFWHIWHIWVHIWARAIWSSGVSLKRSCKMQFRRVGLRSIGPSSQKLWPNQIFGRFPHCNYNVKLKMACRIAFMGL